jgi:hypothetical protein
LLLLVSNVLEKTGTFVLFDYLLQNLKNSCFFGRIDESQHSRKRYKFKIINFINLIKSRININDDFFILYSRRSKYVTSNFEL